MNAMERFLNMEAKRLGSVSVNKQGKTYPYCPHNVSIILGQHFS